MYYSYSAWTMSIVRASQTAAPHVLPNHSDKSDTGKVADKKETPSDKKSPGEGDTKRPHIPQHKQEKRRKHNKATHVKKTINIKPRTSNQLKKMFDPKRGDSEETSSSYYTSSDDS